MYYICPDCDGSGGWSIGDCEDGVWETCDFCDGAGEIEDTQEGL